MNEHHIRAKVFLAAAERLEGVAATQTGAVRSAYREAADIPGKENATSERWLVSWPRAGQPLAVDGRGPGPHRRGPGVNITNNMINMTADERTRRIEELQQKVLEHATPKPGRT